MIVTLNGLSLNDPTTGNGLYLDEPITGLSLPPIRTSSGNFSGRDGGYMGAQYYGGRLISLTGRCYSSSTSTLEDARRTLQSAVAKSSVTMQITSNAGRQYLVNAYLDSFDMPITRAAVSAAFNITLLAPDPIIYDNSAGGVNTAAITRSSGGGLSWPLTWPLTWAAGGAPITVTNSGDVAVYPVITLTGVMTSPIITNTTTGQFFSLPTFTTGTGDQLVIDMRPATRSVLLNGGSVYQFASTTSTWWQLLTGNNSISLTTGNSSDTVTGTVSWMSGYRGI